MSVNQELEEAGLNQRIALIIYLKNVSDQFKLRRFGDIVYFSKKMKYCVLYVNKADGKAKAQEIGHLSFVRGIISSQKDKVDLTGPHIEKQLQDLAKQAEEKLRQKAKENGDLWR